MPDLGPPVLVVGHGLIGGAVADELMRRGQDVVTVSRSCRESTDHLGVSLATREGQDALHDLILRLRPRVILLAHGPSDVTWCNSHEQEAENVHVGVATVVAGSETPAVLISTDNVFDTKGVLNRAEDAVNPANAYGRVKRRAEEMFLRDGRATVLRVSLTYGWSDGRHRRNFAERCLLAAAHEGEFHAPIDQYFTPVYLDDVAVVVAAACLAPQMVPMVAHLAGPERLSRFAFARTAYTIAGRDPDRVRPVSRQDTVWASRPDDSSLLSTDFSAVPRLAGFAACRAAAGLAAMCRSWAGGMGTWAPVMDPASMSQSGAEASPAPQGSTGVGA